MSPVVKYRQTKLQIDALRRDVMALVAAASEELEIAKRCRDDASSSEKINHAKAATRITTNLCKFARWALNDEVAELVNLGDVPDSLSDLAERVRRIAARVAVAMSAERDFSRPCEISN